MRVQDLKLREILATNSLRTIELELYTNKGKVRASVPMGTSRSKYEVEYLPVDEVIEIFSKMKKHFISQNFDNQEDVDILLRIIDKTPAFRQIGGNLALAISSAFLKSFAMHEEKEVFEYLTNQPTMPLPLCNVAGGWKGQSDIQEFLVLPFIQRTFLENIKKIAKVYWLLGKKLKDADRNFNFGKNLESAWITSLPFERILKIMAEIVGENSLEIGMDVAASQFWNEKNHKYMYRYGSMNTPEQLSIMEEILKKYPITYI